MANTKKSSEEKTNKKKTTTTAKNKTSKSVEKRVVKEAKTTQTKKAPDVKKKEEKRVESKKNPKVEEKRVVEAKEETTKSPVKALIIIILLVVFLGGIFYLSTLSGKGEYSEPTTEAGSDTNSGYDGNDTASESASIKEEERSELTSISIDEYLDLKKNKEKYSIIYIGRPTCSHCETQKPIMEHLVYKYGVQINYLNTDSLDEDGFTKLQSSDDLFKEGWGTPLTMIVKDGKIVDYIEGEASIEKMTELFKKYELINEGE